VLSGSPAVVKLDFYLQTLFVNTIQEQFTGPEGLHREKNGVLICHVHNEKRAEPTVFRADGGSRNVSKQ